MAEEMAGKMAQMDSIVLRNGELWIAAGWAFRAVILAIVNELENSVRDQQFGQWLRDQVRDIPSARVIDLRALSDDEQDRFWVAAQAAYDRVKVEGPVGWYDPSFFPGWLKDFSDLISKKP